MTAAMRAPLDGCVPPEIVPSVFHRALDLRTVAEGVETQEQVQAHNRLGATYLQGSSLARPVSGAAAESFFAARQGEQPA